MKYKLLLFASFLAVVLFSCEKEENRVYFEGGTAPVLKASSTADLRLTEATKDNPAISFSWTNPNYQLNTGIGSHDVVYTLQVDTAGANFSSRVMQEAAISKDLSVAYNVKDLNSFFTKMELVEDIPHNIEFRVKASLATNAVPLYSNVIKMKITPYLDVAVPIPPTGELYMTGTAVPSGWTEKPPVSQKMTQVSKTLYVDTVALKPGGVYKFLSTQGQWQPQYGGKSAAGGELGYRMSSSSGSDPDAIPTPGDEGNYKITVNFKSGRYTVEKI